MTGQRCLELFNAVLGLHLKEPVRTNEDEIIVKDIETDILGYSRYNPVIQNIYRCDVRNTCFNRCQLYCAVCQSCVVPSLVFPTAGDTGCTSYFSGLNLATLWFLVGFSIGKLRYSELGILIGKTLLKQYVLVAKLTNSLEIEEKRDTWFL